MQEQQENRVSNLQEMALKFVEARTEESFTHLYHRLRPGLRNQVMKYFSDDETISEILAITLSKAFSLVEMYDPRWHFSTWVYRICTNECLMELRRRAQTYSIEQMTENSVKIKPIDTSGWIVDDPDYEFYETEAIFSSEQVYDEVLEAISTLPKPYRDVLEDREIHKLKYEEIAIKRNVKTNTVRSRIHVAKKLLKQKWLEEKVKVTEKPIRIKNVAVFKQSEIPQTLVKKDYPKFFVDKLIPNS